MKIKLKEIILKNFKGVKDLEIKFGNLTDILGANATGKTTINDAFTWLLFGKDSKDRKDFNIKTLDEEGNELHGLEHSVTGLLEVDGQVIRLQRIYKEKWTKTRGQAKAELKGHTSEYFINEVPSSQKEYQAKINSIFDEDKFKLVTNPLYFTGLKWQEQRRELLEIIGDIDDENVIAYNKKLMPLEDLLTDGIENFNKVTAAKVKKLKDQVKSIPYRIDECNNSILDEDFTELENEKLTISKELSKLDEQLADKSKANEEKIKLQDMLYELNTEFRTKYDKAVSELPNPKLDLENKIRELRYKKQDIQTEIKLEERKRDGICEDIRRSNESISNRERTLEKLRSDFKATKAKSLSFNDNEFMCPTCKREFDPGDIEAKKIEMTENFENSKAARLKEINQSGKECKNAVEKIKADIEEGKATIDAINTKVIELNEKLNEVDKELKSSEEKLSVTSDNPAFQVTFKGMKELQQQIQTIKGKLDAYSEIDNSLLLKEKRVLQDKLEGINKLLGRKENNITLKARIKELEDEEKELAIKIAELEGHQFLGEEFVRTKVELLEEGINEKFKGAVSFKLFNQQINGGLSECCEALVEGVPFSNANTAAQINAGLSILNTLCEHYGVNAPVFIDNAESVNKVNYTDSQLIKLIVSLDKKIKVEVVE